jgi:hypothetical protein
MMIILFSEDQLTQESSTLEEPKEYAPIHIRLFNEISFFFSKKNFANLNILEAASKSSASLPAARELRPSLLTTTAVGWKKCFSLQGMLIRWATTAACVVVFVIYLYILFHPTPGRRKNKK